MKINEKDTKYYLALLESNLKDLPKGSGTIKDFVNHGGVNGDDEDQLKITSTTQGKSKATKPANHALFQHSTCKKLEKIEEERQIDIDCHY